MSINAKPEQKTTSTVILIVDDSADIRRLLIRRLNAAGFTDLVTAASACDAFQILGMLERPQDAPRIDLILMDVSMPGMDGIEACRRITSTAQVSNIPIIMVTAHDEDGYSEAAFEAGAAGYISKSLGREELGVIVRSALARIQQTRNLV